jgi:peptidoglycan/LPS O-acetylase OafA/YrhL
LGVLIGYFHDFHTERFARSVTSCGELLWLAGLASFAAVFVWGGPISPGFFPVVAQLFVLALGTGMIVSHGVFLRAGMTRALVHPLWSPLARVSYGSYLIHPFVIFGALIVWPGGADGAGSSLAQLLVLTVIVIALTLLAAAVLHLAVERPLLRLGAALSGRARR